MRMANRLFSKQEVIKLLSQFGKLRVEYPPELLVARRRLFVNMAAQVAATRAAVDSGRKRWLFSIVHEPGSTVIKVLIAVFVAFLIAFVVHFVVNGEVNFEWIMELILP